jgi:hypothetical protein
LVKRRLKERPGAFFFEIVGFEVAVAGEAVFNSAMLGSPIIRFYAWCADSGVRPAGGGIGDCDVKDRFGTTGLKPGFSLGRGTRR